MFVLVANITIACCLLTLLLIRLARTLQADRDELRVWREQNAMKPDRGARWLVDKPEGES